MRVLVAYGCAHYGKSLFWFVSELFFAFYLTEVAGFAPHHMGGVLGVGLVASAFIDLLVGWKFGGRLQDAAAAGRIQLLGAVVSAIALTLVFMTDALPPALRIAYALAIGLVFRIAYAAYDLPQNALLSLRDWPTLGRGGVAAVRLIGSGMAMLTVGFTIGVAFAAGADGERMPLIIAVFCMIAVATAWWLRQSLREEASRACVARDGAPMRWRPLVVPILLVFVVSAAFSAFSKLETYFGVYTLGTATWGARIAVAYGLGLMLLQPLWAILYVRLGRRLMLGALSLGLAVFALGFLVWASGSPVLALGFGFCLGAANGGFGLLLWAWFADETARSAQGRESLSFGAFTAASKLALAAGGLYVAAALTILDYRNAHSAWLAGVMTLLALLAAAVGLGVAARLTRPSDNPIRSD